MDNKIDLNNPGHIKLCLLSQGVRIINPNIFNTNIFAANQFPYGYSNKSIKRFPKIPSELVLPEEVIVGLHIRKNSPWILDYDVKAQKTYLSYKDKQVTQAWFNPQPLFYGKKTSSGTLTEKTAVMYGLYTLSFFTRGWCYYFIQKKQCKFCSLAPTRGSLGKENATSITPEMAAEVAKLALQLDNNRIFYINHCSGSHKDNDLGVLLQLRIVATLHKIIPCSVKQHMLTMPPNDSTYIQQLKDAGLDTLNFAIEVFDPLLFQKVCPGKHSYYGYDRLLNMYDKAVSIMGKGNMYANFVGGLEPIESLSKGFEYFSKRGIVPSVNIFHPDPQSLFAQKNPPSLDYLFELVKLQSSIYRKNNFKPIFPRGGTRNSLDTEVYKGYFI